MRERNGFPVPDWTVGGANVDDWLDTLRPALGRHYEIIESDHFVAVSGVDARAGDLLVATMERSYERLCKQLPNIVRPQREKYVALLFDSQKRYFQYATVCDSDEGEEARSVGMYVPGDVPQFLVAPASLDEQELTVLHELAHAFVAHLPLPHWLNEGFAENAEGLSPLHRGLYLSTDLAEKHRDHWDERSIQHFWDGQSFRATGTQGISYSLAGMLVDHLARKPRHFDRFMNAATFEDAGESAARATYDRSLGDFVELVLGEGEWAPRA